METRMIVACEACGKQYRVDPREIHGEAAAFTCQGCQHRITVYRPDHVRSLDPAYSDALEILPDTRTTVPGRTIAHTQPRATPSLRRGLRFGKSVGLRARMLILFFLLPGLVLALATYFLLNLFIVGSSLLVIGLIVVGYSFGLSGRIVALTRVADQISLGELDVKIDTRARDEIGAMAMAIERMKDSIQISMERLRRRRRH